MLDCTRVGVILYGKLSEQMRDLLQGVSLNKGLLVLQLEEDSYVLTVLKTKCEALRKSLSNRASSIISDFSLSEVCQIHIGTFEVQHKEVEEDLYLR